MTIVPVTLVKTTFTGVLATAAVGKGQVQVETWSQTTYPNGNTVTRLHHQPIEVYDHKAVVTRYDVRSNLDVMI